MYSTAVQLWGIRGQILEREPFPLGVDELAHYATAMRLQTIPDHKDGTVDMAQQVREELNDLWARALNARVPRPSLVDLSRTRAYRSRALKIVRTA